MGLVTTDDSWHISDELRRRIKPLLRKRSPHPLSYQPLACSRPGGNECHFVGAVHGYAVECLESHGHLLFKLGSSTFSRMD